MRAYTHARRTFSTDNRNARVPLESTYVDTRSSHDDGGKIHENFKPSSHPRPARWGLEVNGRHTHNV